MSVALPVVALVFGSVAPPQGDILDLRVHLGCTNEVSSFSCLLQNFDKKYTETSPINVGDNGSLNIGRGTNCPLIATIRVEEVACESTSVENYLRAKALLAHLENPAESITIQSTIIDYGTDTLLPGDKIHVTLPNENIDADYRIISVEYKLNAATQTLEIALELGKETPLLADYLYTLQSKSSSLARYKRGQ